MARLDKSRNPVSVLVWWQLWVKESSLRQVNFLSLFHFWFEPLRVWNFLKRTGNRLFSNKHEEGRTKVCKKSNTRILLDYFFRFCVTVVRLNSLYQMRNKLQFPSCNNLSSIYKCIFGLSLRSNPVFFFFVTCFVFCPDYILRRVSLHRLSKRFPFCNELAARLLTKFSKCILLYLLIQQNDISATLWAKWGLTFKTVAFLISVF